MTGKYPVEIRFSDVDMAGHVHNAAYFQYFEMSRIKFFYDKIAGKNWDWKKQSLVVAHNEIDYFKPIFLNDRIEVEVSIAEMGTKSFKLLYQVMRGEEICAKGNTVMVCFDVEQQTSIAIPKEWLEKITV